MQNLEFPFDHDSILKKKKAIKRVLVQQNELLDIRVAIFGGSTIGDIKDILEIFLLNFGFKPIFFIGEYNRFYEELYFKNQKLLEFNPDIIFIHTSVRNLNDSALFDKLQAIWEKIKTQYACPVIQNNFEQPDCTMIDIDHEKITVLNHQLAEYAKQNKDLYINDIYYLSSYYGLEKWHNNQNYYLYKYALDIKAIPLLCHSIAKTIKTIYGKNQKCLVLDLDNTLWGGVVGEVGVSGIELGPDTPLGEAYWDFQKYVKKLTEKGILLAVCSKNNEDIALEAFKNPNMVLQPDDFSLFLANWDNKDKNIIKIANTLNILPESIVFIDDNPAEREIVRNSLPEVKVPEVNSAADFIRCIEWNGYFNAIHISDDDQKRTMYYKADTQRNVIKSTFDNYGDYLQSLCMKSEIQPFETAHLERITQLINKTNQFNLTTERYTYSQIEKIASDPAYITLYATLDDKFGSNGIVSALIGENDGEVLHLRLWVMSCRVFKRDLELAIFDHLVALCRKNNIKKLMGYYYKTTKNAFVANLYKDLGFEQVTSDAWEYILPEKYHNKNNYITINRSE